MQNGIWLLLNFTEAKSLRIVDGGRYLTEFEGEIEESTDMGWWYVGSVCYKKFQKNKKEIEIEVTE